jgi:hypothetical protein
LEGLEGAAAGAGRLTDDAVPARPSARLGPPILLFSLLVVLVWADPLLFQRNFTGRDLLPYNLPMEKMIHDAYAAGRLPVWSEEISGGRPLLPNPNAGALYPVRPMLSLLPFPLAMRIYPVLHWMAAGIGTMLLVSSLGASRAGAWLGAVTYAFSGVSISDAFFPHIQPGMTLLPWILWAVRRPAATPARRIPLLALLFGLDLLAADIFTAGLAMAAAALWLVTETPRSKQLAEFGCLVVGVLLGALVAAPQIVATALWIPETNRAVLGMKLWDVTLFSISPWRLLEFFVPYLFGPAWELRTGLMWGGPAVFNARAFGLFSTLYVGALAPLAVGKLRRQRLMGLKFARVLLLVGLAVSVLPSRLPHSLGNLRSPLPLRNPEKLAVGVVLALAIFAALGFDAYRREGRSIRLPLALGGLLASAALVCALWPAAAGRVATSVLGSGPERRAVAAAELPLAFAEAGLLWMATLVALALAPRSNRFARVLSVGLLTLVPIEASRKIPEICPAAEDFAPTPFARRVMRADPHGAFRVLGEVIYRPVTSADPLQELSELGIGEEPRRSWAEYTPALWGRGTVFNGDFDSGDLARVESLRRISAIAAGFRDSGAFFQNLSLRWGIRMRRQEPVSSYRPVGGDAVMAWDVLEPALPDIRLATRWREESGSLAALDAIREITPGELLLETGRRASGSARPGRLAVLEKSPWRVRLSVEAPDATWLFVLREYWSHRRIWLDGREVESVPAYLAFSAVPVPAGRHGIDWQEGVPGGRVSRFGPLLAGAVIAILLVRGREGKGK